MQQNLIMLSGILVSDNVVMYFGINMHFPKSMISDACCSQLRLKKLM
jgi:hypothetical protein